MDERAHRHDSDRPVVSDMVITFGLAALSGAIVGGMIAATIVWLSAGGS